jgi:hypothetical protein
LRLWPDARRICNFNLFDIGSPPSTLTKSSFCAFWNAPYFSYGKMENIGTFCRITSFDWALAVCQILVPGNTGAAKIRAHQLNRAKPPDEAAPNSAIQKMIQ